MSEGEHNETKGAELEGRTTIATPIPALRLMVLTADDADTYGRLVPRTARVETGVRDGAVCVTVSRLYSQNRRRS
jgi:hypothetical protein